MSDATGGQRSRVRLVAVVALRVVAAALALVWIVNRSDQTVRLPAEPRPTTTTVNTEQNAAFSAYKIRQGARPRLVRVALPVDHPADERLPVVVFLHGYNSRPIVADWNGNWSSRVTEHRFMAVFPQGLDESWNAGPCCRPASVVDTDDVGFLDAVFADLKRRPDVDTTRMFLVGQSNGGMMAIRYLCEGSHRVVAAVSVAGPNTPDCVPREPVRFLTLAGDRDDVTPLDGGSGVLGFLVGQPSPSFRSTFEMIGDGWRCEPTTSTTSPAMTTLRRDCNGVELRLSVIAGGDHSWPKRPVDAAAEILDFFDLARP